MYDAALDNLDAVRDAAIPVELINGPIMLVSGDSDRMWPSTRMAEKITRRLAEHGRADRVTHLRYQAAGHSLSREGRAAVKKMGIRGRMFDLGGTMDADAAAGDDAWPKVVEFMLAALA
jgi:dienelactone hydrolase